MNNQSKNDYDKNLSWSENLEESQLMINEQDDGKKGFFIPLIKTFSMMILAMAVLIFVSLCWFAMNESVGTNGLMVKARKSLFELKTSGSAGLYDGDGFLGEVAPGYTSALTTEGVQGIKWKLVSNESEMNNLYKGQGDPNLREITRLDSDQYGLKPGDHGTLKFTIEPKTTDELEIQCVTATTGYKATYDVDNYKTNAPMTLVSDEQIVHFLSSHILYFYMGTDNHKHMLTEEGFTEIVNNGLDKEVTLYWVWPATLLEILNENIDGLNDRTAAVEVKRFFFEHPEYFLKPIGEVSFDAFTVECLEDKAAEDAEIAQVIQLVSNRNYNQYGAMYNDADQAIGDNVNYILVELFAGLKTDDE